MSMLTPYSPFQDVINSYLSDRKKYSNELTIHTMKSYSHKYFSSFSSTPICDISAAEVLDFQWSLKNNHRLSQSTKYHIWRLLVNVFIFAQNNHLVLTNPCDSCPSMSVPPSYQNSGFSVQEIKTLLPLFEVESLGTLFGFCLFTGLHPQEILPLRYSDIDFENGKISISHELKYTVTREPLIFPATKPRIISISTQALYYLHKQALAQLSMQQYTGIQSHKELLFTTVHGKPYVPANISNSVHNMQLKSGVTDFNIINLINHYITTSLINHVDVFMLADNLGYSSVNSLLARIKRMDRRC